MTSSKTTFNDAELNKTLIARLRMVTGFIRFETGDRVAAAGCLSEEAADRIELLATTNEQLVATNEALSISNATLIAERDALFRRATLAEEWRDHDKTRAEAAEAKLAKAVEALGYIESMAVHSGGEIHGVTALQWKVAFEEAQDVTRSVLAEIKGESHE